MVLAKLELVAFMALAACAAAVMIGMTLAGPPVPGIQPPSHEARTSEAESPIVPGTGFTNVPKTDRGIPESQPPIPAEEKGNPIIAVPERRRSVLGEQVERAIRDGVRFLKAQQRPNGDWADFDADAKTGTTSLVTLALLSAGEKPDSPTVRKALEYLRGFGPDDLRSTYAISLQTQVFAAAEPRARPVADHGQRRVAGERSDSSRRRGLLARLVELHQYQAHQAR